MADKTRDFTPDSARHFDRYSVANAATVTEALPCGCEPYVDVFTYRRWKSQGYQVQRGQKAVRLPVLKQFTRRDRETGEESTRRVFGRSAVFCRCQVEQTQESR